MQKKQNSMRVIYLSELTLSTNSVAAPMLIKIEPKIAISESSLSVYDTIIQNTVYNKPYCV